MKKLHTFLFALGLAFLIFLVQKTGLRQLWQELTLLGWGLVPIILAEGVAELFHAISWRYCFSGPHRSISLARLYRIHMAGYAVNFLTPTASLAGEITRAGLLANKRHGPEAATAVLIGKISFALSQLLFVTAGSIVVLPALQVPVALKIALVSSGAALAAGILIFLLLQKQGKLTALIRWLIARNIFAGTLRRLVRPMERVDEILKAFYRERPRDLVLSVFWHLIGYSVGIFALWYFLSFLTGRPAFATAARIWFLAQWIDFVTFAVPYNLGVLEGGRIIAFRAFGFGALPGMTFGAVTRMAQLFWAGFGLVNYALLITRAQPSERANSRSDAERFEAADPDARERFQIHLQGAETTKISSPEISL